MVLQIIWRCAAKHHHLTKSKNTALNKANYVAKVALSGKLEGFPKALLIT